ncbi:MAG: hypothetical protein GVY36_06635 [Verrucomicrobia bacterium]|jgi:hypothetical protein|nr:hypothetical protein [Verrucomicrobiota bacterium]
MNNTKVAYLLILGCIIAPLLQVDGSGGDCNLELARTKIELKLSFGPDNWIEKLRSGDSQILRELGNPSGKYLVSDDQYVSFWGSELAVFYTENKPSKILIGAPVVVREVLEEDNNEGVDWQFIEGIAPGMPFDKVAIIAGSPHQEPSHILRITKGDIEYSYNFYQIVNTSINNRSGYFLRSVLIEF